MVRLPYFFIVSFIKWVSYVFLIQGLNFMIHADAAWGGYFCTMLRTPPNPLDNTNEKAKWFVPELSLGSYTGEQLASLFAVDTVTIDPHKTGFCPYPGGAICYRDKRINRFLNISNQAVYYHGAVNLGDIGIEGSKPGASAAGIAMAHRVSVTTGYFEKACQSLVVTSLLVGWLAVWLVG